MITLNDYLTASGSYPERSKSNELTPELLANAQKLIEAINAFMKELGVSQKLKVSSGFRPSAVNAGIANAAKKSLHQKCLAIDVLDDSTQSIAKAAASKPELLRKYGLFIENPSFTKGKNTNWCHLDLGTRSDRPSRMFNP
jgi:Peptidase M15